MGVLTLKQEAKIIKLKRKVESIEAQGKRLKRSEYIHMLLPRYDMKRNHEGRAVLWHDATQTEKGIKGGVGSGKTTTIMPEVIFLSFTNRPEFHFSLSPSFDNACETIIVVLNKLCDENDLAYDWIPSNNLFKIYWGDEDNDTANILVHGMDSNWLGVDAASGDLNEPFSIKKKSYEDWGDRIRNTKAKLRAKLWGGTAIPEKMQWGFEFYDHEKINTPLLYADTFTTYGNLFLSKEYIAEQESKYVGKAREVKMLGKCIKLVEGDAVYPSYDVEKNVKPFNVNEPAEFVVSFDFNVNPMTALLGSVKSQKIHISKDFKIKKSKTRELCLVVINCLRDEGYLGKDGYSIHGASIIITGDQTGEKEDTRTDHLNDYLIILEEFNKAGIQYTIVVPSKNPSVRDSANDVDTALETLVLVHDPICKDLSTTFNMTAWKEGGKGILIDEQKEWGHHSACIRYLVKHTKEIHMASETEGNRTGSVQINSSSRFPDNRRH